MKIKSLKDETGPFEVTVHESNKGAPVVLFASGAGGLPERYLTLLNVLIEAGYTVVAPHFERFGPASPTVDELTLRGRRLSQALDAFSYQGTQVLGVGHSIGATTLVALAGAQMWLAEGQQIDITADARLTRLALLAPPTGYFQAPGALDGVGVPIQVWVGTADTITPPAQSKWLVQALAANQTVNLDLIDGAGHFSFMDVTPPNVVEPLANKQMFLHQYSNAVVRYLQA